MAMARKSSGIFVQGLGSVLEKLGRGAGGFRRSTRCCYWNIDWTELKQLECPWCYSEWLATDVWVDKNGTATRQPNWLWRKNTTFLHSQHSVVTKPCYLGQERRQTAIMTRLRLGNCGKRKATHCVIKHWNRQHITSVFLSQTTSSRS